MMRYHRIVSLLMGLFFGAYCSFAFCQPLFSAEWFLGLKTIEAKEFVLNEDNGKKISELHWESQDVPFLGIQLAWMPTTWSKIYGRYETQIKHGTSIMKDSDWMDGTTSLPTHYSWHPQTDLKEMNQWEIGVELPLFKTQHWQTAFLLNFENIYSRWDAKGGFYQYPDGAGSFPNDASIIGYQQWVRIPRVGILIRYNQGPWMGSLEMKASRWVRARDQDDHWQRLMRFKDKVQNADYFSLQARVGYEIFPDTVVFLNAGLNRMSTEYGSTLVTDLLDGESWKIEGDSAGMNFKSSFVFVGLGKVL